MVAVVVVTPLSRSDVVVIIIIKSSWLGSSNGPRSDVVDVDHPRGRAGRGRGRGGTRKFMPPKSDSEVVEVVESDHFASKSSLDLTLVVIDSPAKEKFHPSLMPSFRKDCWFVHSFATSHQHNEISSSSSSSGDPLAIGHWAIGPLTCVHLIYFRPLLPPSPLSLPLSLAPIVP